MSTQPNNDVTFISCLKTLSLNNSGLEQIEFELIPYFNQEEQAFAFYTQIIGYPMKAEHTSEIVFLFDHRYPNSAQSFCDYLKTNDYLIIISSVDENKSWSENVVEAINFNFRGLIPYKNYVNDMKK